MELNLSKNNIKTLRKVAESENKASYEWDIIVPDSKPDIKSILKADASCYLTDKEIMQDRAMLSGEAAINILYIPQDESGMIRNIESNQSFNYVMELSGLRQDMSLTCFARVVDVKAKVINSRKVSVLCVIQFNGSASAEDEVTYLDNAEGENIEFLKKKIVACKTVADSENYITIDEEFEIPMGKPSASEILEVKMKFNERDVRPMDGKVLVKGELGTVVIYNSDSEGDELQYIEFSIPFTEIFEEEGISENSFYDADFYIENVRCSIMPDSEGENRKLLIEGTIAICGKGYENTELDAIVDMYSTEGGLELTGSEYCFNEIADYCEGRAVIKDTIEADKQSPIKNIINIVGTDRVKGVTANDGSVTVEGSVTVDILYHSEQNNIPVSYITKEIPFKTQIDCETSREASAFEVKTIISSISYNILNPLQLELKMIVDIGVRQRKQSKDNILSDALVKDQYDGENGGLAIYFCDGNESLWEIAKKYRKPMQRLMEINELNGENDIKKGMKLLIP